MKTYFFGSRRTVQNALKGLRFVDHKSVKAEANKFTISTIDGALKFPVSRTYNPLTDSRSRRGRATVFLPLPSLSIQFFSGGYCKIRGDGIGERAHPVVYRYNNSGGTDLEKSNEGYKNVCLNTYSDGMATLLRKKKAREAVILMAEILQNCIPDMQSFEAYAYQRGILPENLVKKPK